MEINSESGSRIPRCLDMTTLKIIAAVSMLIDHIGCVLFPRIYWLRGIGRLAMPIYCFGISEGLAHTTDRKNYLFRMGLFSLISEVPFDLAFNGGPELYSQNVMLTFFCAIAGIMAFEEIRKISPSFVFSLLAAACAVAFAAAAKYMCTDYGEFGVILVYVLYFTRRFPVYQLLAGTLTVCVCRWMDFEMICLPAFLLLLFYNGEKGKDLKHFFYYFYPFHLSVLALIDRMT